MPNIIKPRPGVEVFLNRKDTISIRQVGEPFPEEGDLVTVDPDDVEDLIEMLKRERQKYDESAARH